MNIVRSVDGSVLNIWEIKDCFKGDLNCVLCSSKCVYKNGHFRHLLDSDEQNSKCEKGLQLLSQKIWLNQHILKLPCECTCVHCGNQWSQSWQTDLIKKSDYRYDNSIILDIALFSASNKDFVENSDMIAFISFSPLISFSSITTLKGIQQFYIDKSATVIQLKALTCVVCNPLNPLNDLNHLNHLNDLKNGHITLKSEAVNMTITARTAKKTSTLTAKTVLKKTLKASTDVLKETIFQAYDWHTIDEMIDDITDDSVESVDSVEDDDKSVEDHRSAEYVTRIFCITPLGVNTTIRVTGFTPFFWIELPRNWQRHWTPVFISALKESLPKHMREEMMTSKPDTMVRDKFKFRDYQWNKTCPFMLLRFTSDRAMQKVYWKLKKPMLFSLGGLRNHTFPIYEKNISPVLRLIHLRNLKPSGWIRVGSSATIDLASTASTSEHDQNISVKWTDIHPADNSPMTNGIGPLKIASFDIEADSSHGDFPIAKKDYFKLAMNIQEEHSRCRNSKISVTPAKIEEWINVAFREYRLDKGCDYSIEIKSSIQTIILKQLSINKIKLFAVLEEVSLECFRILSKAKINSVKEIVNALREYFNKMLPAVKGDKVIQIGTVLYRYGQEKKTIHRHIITLGGCDAIPGVEVVACQSVKQLFVEWVKFMRRVQPNIITGYNIFGFDFKFMWECAEEYDCVDVLKSLGPLKNIATKLGEKELFSAALGHNFLYYFEMPGIITIDLMKVIQRDHNLSSYKLDNVSTDFINGAITRIDYVTDLSVTLYTKTTFSLHIGQYLLIYKSSIVGKEFVSDKCKITSINENESITITINETSKDDNDEFQRLPENPKYHFWSVGKDDVSPQDIFSLQRGTDSDRAIVAKYCVQDCELCLNLMQKLEIITNNIGMSNVCLVPLSYLYMRGQMIKTLSLVSSECHKENYLIPELPKPALDVKESYEGAEVLEPTPGIYLDDPISVLDYGSLYPSSMIGTNISHDTIIKDPRYLGDEGGRRLTELGLKYDDVTYDNYYNKLVGKTWKKIISASEPTVTCRYIQPSTISETSDIIDDTKRGILPKILMKLLSARKATKRLIENEKDPFRRSVLDGLQSAYKITANSLYGGVGAAVSALYYKDIAASTTAVGRAHLHLAKSYVYEVFPSAEVVYGDTDSIFVNFHPTSESGEKLTGNAAIMKSIEMSQAVEHGIQTKLKNPHKLEYEKTFYPFILLRKKGYIGNKYEFNTDHYKQTSMGVVTKRRDNAPIVKYVYDGIITLIINERDIEASISFLKDTINKIMNGEFPMSYFIITKNLRSEYAVPQQIVHKVLADRMAARDPGNKPQSNDRIPYAYVRTKTVPKLQGDRVEHPDFIKQKNLTLDYLFYITNQIQKPVCQVYALALESLRPHGYNLPENYFEKLTTEYEQVGKTNIREKIMDKKMDEVYKVLFKRRVDVEEGRRFGQSLVSDYFRKK
jgi:DNA polymerase elongation subunit (family B)